MNRRTTDVSGFVNFPINDDTYKSTEEGGMFVHLVVLEPNYDDMWSEKWEEYQRKAWTKCCVSFPHMTLGESLIGTDKDLEDFGEPPIFDDENPKLSYDRGDEWELNKTRKYFPNYRRTIPERDKRKQGRARRLPSLYEALAKAKHEHISTHFLNITILGTTGWSGYSNDLGYWICTFDDLTEEGEQLYKLMEKLYPGCEVRLLTWLDT